jgi:hypothetical protein
MTPSELEVLENERKYWQAMCEDDLDTMLALSDEPCLIAGAQGVGSIDRQKLRQMMQQASWKLHGFELGPSTQVRLLRDDVAVVAYQVKEDVSIDGQRLQLEANDSSTWIKKNGRWVCALHSEAIAGDPFGRDKRPS